MLEVLSAVLASDLVGVASRTTFDALWRMRRRARLTTLILQALELDAKAHGQALEFPSGVSGRAVPGEWDALLPSGLGDLAGPLGVGLWLPSQAGGTADLLFQQLDSKSAEAAARRDLAGLLFIHSLTLSEADSQRLGDYVRDRPADSKLYVWGPAEVLGLIERHKDEIGKLLPELALAPLRADLQGPEPDWRSQSSMRLGRLADIYHSEGVVLALGAGVSIGMGVPNWDELVSALFVSLVTKQLTESIDEDQALALADAARKVGQESPLLSARYLRRGLEDGSAGDPRAFQQALAAVLYGHVGASKAASPLLRELAKICMPLRTGPKVHSVITYNFDDLLEEVLLEEGIQHRSIYSARLHPLETELPIFHAHGFLPRDIGNFDGLEEGLLAFSEEGYHQLFRDPYHWTNVIQLQAFQQQTCIFVGLSLTDPNLRRLLEYAATSRDEPRHFAFMKRTSVQDLLSSSRKDAGGHATVTRDAASDFLRVHHSLQERVYSELGLEVIWFDSYTDMPKAVAKLRA
jgi:hypothetical protein